jgi:aminopeptidase N
MQKTLLGEEDYRKATDLYFEQFDGKAVTCDDFVACMEKVSNKDLTQFKLWYSQAGTPVIKAQGSYNENEKTYKLKLTQTVPPTPGQPEKKPMHIPVKVGLVGPNGDDMAEELVELKKDSEEFTFENIARKPVPSILRGFSAPVKLETDLSNEDLKFLMVHDNDGFNRWEAAQTYALRIISEMLDQHEKGHDYPTDPEFIASYVALIETAFHPETDKALLARFLTLPDIPIIAQQRRHIDPTAIYEVRQAVIRDITRTTEDYFLKIYNDNKEDTFSNRFESRAKRALKNTALRYLIINQNEQIVSLAKEQYDNSHNMTDRAFALSCLADTHSQQREQAFSDFYTKYKNYQLVIDKWFSLQAMAVREQVIEDIYRLKEHPEFIMTNPNRVRALVGSFAMGNPVWFHSPDAKGYEFLTETVIDLNGKNPQIAARLLTPMRDWRRYTPDRQKAMQQSLERIAKIPDISNDVFEIVSKSLA